MPLPIPRLAPVMSAILPLSFTIPSLRLRAFYHIHAVIFERLRAKFGPAVAPLECDGLRFGHGQYFARPRGVAANWRTRCGHRAIDDQRVETEASARAGNEIR